ncbi:hypothetical protein MBLNU459_g7929t2 [Dothideomycetes sp. NU459]
MLFLSQFLRLDASVRLASIATIASLLCAHPVLAQTYSSCNPLEQSGCPADTALGTSATYSFTSGASKAFTATGEPTYDSNGVSFTVAKSGDAPLLTSNWYIMFGKVEVVAKAAPGAGIVSSSVLQSDDLDEIDWEWLGSQSDQVQSNYFGKGDATTSGRGAVLTTSDTQDAFHTYTIEWTSTEIVWQVDGTTLRVLEATGNSEYPQTPMVLKIGVWSGGDSSNPAGTIAWAQGPTDYSKGPFTMTVKSVTAQDYSTGTSYSYSGTSGDWTSIKAAGGSVNGGPSSVDTAAPAITSTASGAVPFDGTHRDTTSIQSTPGIGTWALATTMATSTSTTYPGLPSGWVVNASGKIVAPSAAPIVSIPSRFVYLLSCGVASGFLFLFWH